MIPAILVQTMHATVELKDKNSTTTRQIPLKWLLPAWEYESLRVRIRIGLESWIEDIDMLDKSGMAGDG